ncbi:MAG: hypothetical protein GF417_04175 [Candidatus Latescibacteria bacterium]|nr:hypothetical protein [bacterium]MBD3423623.1 hypothetical protein [Candidatus Latescibacterota bacterium]
MKEFFDKRPVAGSIILWVIALIATLLCISYQDRTGPTYPLDGDVTVCGQKVRYHFQRSETIGRTLKIVLSDPVPEGAAGSVQYRRLNSEDDWSVVGMERGIFDITRRGRTETYHGIGARLPSLKKRAGKYEYYVYLSCGEEPSSVTGEEPVIARYKGAVPTWALIVHIVVMFGSMTIAVRTFLEAIVDGRYWKLLWATVISLVLGGFVLGPLVQWYAFGVWWDGIPFGYDLTDNKVLIELVFWLLACYMNRGGRRSRWSVYIAAVVTLIVYFIPHSMLGSEYNYRAGEGRGTAG